MDRPTSLRASRGFTLVELMVAMVIASILIGLIFAVYTRMSIAYQTQNRITEVMQNLRSAQERLVRELRVAGDQLPQPDYQPAAGTPPRFFPALGASETMIAAGVNYNGISIAGGIDPFGHGPGTPIQPIYITNGGGTEPDQIRFFYADRAIAAKVEESPTFTLADPMVISLVDHDTTDGISPVDQFNDGDYVVLVNSTQEEISMDVTGDGLLNTFETPGYEACLLRITSRDNTPGVNTVTFSSSSSPHNANNSLGATNIHHCKDVRAQHVLDIARPAAARADTMLYRLVGRAYRIDPARRNAGVLQVSESGELNPNDWQDLGVGFTNLQVASQWYENADGPLGPRDADGDGDPSYDWYSGDNQDFLDLATSLPARRRNNAVMVRISLSLETRTLSSLEGVPTTQIPGYIGSGPINNNNRGDSPAIVLPSADPRYSGDNIFRWTRSVIEFRNIGRGH